MEVEPQVRRGSTLLAKRVGAPTGSRRALARISPDIVVRKLLRRLWSTRRAIAVVRDLGAPSEPPAGLHVEFVPADGFDALPRLVEDAVGLEYLYVRPIERTRQARAGTLSVARDAQGELMAFHFVHAADDHKALNRVAPNMYPPMQHDEVLTEAVYCLPAFRGRAIAPQLLVATGTSLSTRGIRRAWAYLDTRNTAALRMFNRAGYVPSGTERVDRYRFGRFSTEFRDLTQMTADEWDVGIAGSRERAA